MHADRYGNPLSSGSADACLAYKEGLDRLLAATAGMEACFRRAVEADDGFALGHLGLARARKILGQGGDIAGPLSRARELSRQASLQEQGLVHCIGTLLTGDGVSAWKAIRAHVTRYPRDVLAVQPTTGVFGLIGFSGRADREKEHRDWCEFLAPHFDGDWWFLAQLGFARVESGDAEVGRLDLLRSLEGNPDNANAAHYYGHALYELGQHAEGSDWLTRWMRGYEATGPMSCHLYWHLARPHHAGSRSGAPCQCAHRRRLPAASIRYRGTCVTVRGMVRDGGIRPCPFQRTRNLLCRSTFRPGVCHGR